MPATTAPFNAHMDRVLAPARDLPANSRILDAGCGRGDVARWLAEQGHDVLGVDTDLAPELLTDRRPHGGGALALRRQDLLTLPAGTPYDAVLLLGVLHFAGSAAGVTAMLRHATALAGPAAPLALSWICDEVPLVYEEGYLPGRQEVNDALAVLGWRPAEMWDRDVSHRHGGLPQHDHRIVYGVWYRA
ncbi:hypothetical protein ADL22_23055 [Streptomyces sp. NRRL F-4489]|uniref:class I SAM-dependent methyltransferase n=1 Tax=Streptomyces sp. NRRL F-4489 TaxID=1609095 RepID=UPI000746BDE1|nr:class I SAM-dependent methyltransferase [Streptomyces sp. NRRL F-4489]KUL37000.1 hypothetical protein ADL22_23055 [Streptomyces sp. NRRL F-4489]